MGIPKILTNMDPVLLFSVVSKDGTKKRVYYALQYGVVMDGTTTEGSAAQVAKYISKQSQFVSCEPGEINPGDLSVESIIESIGSWLVDGYSIENYNIDNEDEYDNELYG